MKTALIIVTSFTLGVALTLLSIWLMTERQAQLDADNAPDAVAWADGHGSIMECARVDQDGKPVYACSVGGRID
jgi:hypothetical protein